MPFLVVNMKRLICVEFPMVTKSEAVSDTERMESFVLINKYSESHGIWPSLINLLKESRLLSEKLN